MGGALITETMAALTVDLSRLPQSTRETIRRSLGDKNAAKLAIARANQARLANVYRQAVAPGNGSRIGPLDTVVDPYLVSYFSRVCEAKEMVWDDPEFIAWLKKNEPATAVPHATTRIQVGYRKP